MPNVLAIVDSRPVIYYMSTHLAQLYYLFQNVHGNYSGVVCLVRICMYYILVCLL